MHIRLLNHFSEKKLLYFLGAFVFLFIASILGMFVFIKTHEDFAANFADDYLRPTIGNQATIQIESAFFKMEDKTNKIVYLFKKPTAEGFTPQQPQKVSAKDNTDNTFLLTPITSLHFFPLLKDEGQWQVMTSSQSAVLMARTFVRPDKERPYATVALVKMNMDLLTLSAVAGTWEPAEGIKKSAGKVPLDIQNSNSLVAAFNGGFQKKDGAYGMIVANTAYLPLQPGLATLVMYKNDKPKLIEFNGSILGTDILAIRQNGPLILKNGDIATSSHAFNMATWGLTTTNSMYTWRSGIGITKNGNIIYAVGPSLVPETLALALKAAGAVDAMQLDINPIWVRFASFTPLGNGKYSYTPLLQDMVNGGWNYLNGYQKDFFYVYKK